MQFSTRWQSWKLTGAAAAGHLLFLALLYWSIRRLGLISDGWAILGEVPEGASAAFRSTIGYHYIPVAGLLVQAGRTIFGVRSAPWQVANLLQFALVAHLVFQLGRRLMPPWLAFVASLVFLANCSFHEITHWSVVGNIHSLAVTFYLAGMLVVLDLRDRAPLACGALLALCATLGTFTYEGMISLVPAASVILFLGLDWSAHARWRDRIELVVRRVVLPVLPCLLVFVLAGVAKLRFPSQLDAGMSLGLDSPRIVHLARGVAGLFSLRAAEDALQGMVLLGSPDPSATATFAKAWVLLGAVVLGVVVVKFRRSVPALLLSWLAVHLALTVVSISMASRHRYLPAVPAALLTAWALGALCERLGRGLGTAAPRTLTVVLTTAAALVLVLAAGPDRRQARRLWAESSRANRDAARAVSEWVPRRKEPVTVCYLNMPATNVARGIGTYTFQNGLTEIGRLFGGGRVGAIDLAYTVPPTPTSPYASGSREVSPQEVQGWIASEDRLVIAFDGEARQVRVLTPSGVGVWSSSPQPR